MNDFVRGSCQYMCPVEEYRERREQGLLHKFETNPSTAVKAFARPAAGQVTPKSANLRPAKILSNTVDYLFTQVIAKRSKEHSFAFLYDFVFDRLRAVRQDIVVQGYFETLEEIDTVVSILEHCAFFYIYSQYRLGEESLNVFSGKLNSNHLHECVEELLSLYSEQAKTSQTCSSQQVLIEGFHVLTAETNYQLQHYLNLPPSVRANPILKNCFAIKTCLFVGNFARAFKIAECLPVILRIAFACTWSEIRKRALLVFEKSYRTSKGAHFPLPFLTRLLHFDDCGKAADFCEVLGLAVDKSNSSVLFKSPSALKSDLAPLQLIQSRLIEKELKKYFITELLIGKFDI